jgi:hypothetical protein
MTWPGQSGGDLLHDGPDGFVSRGGSLVHAEQRCLMLGGGESDQGVISRFAADI